MRHSTGHVGERITIAYAHIDNQHLRIVEMLGQAVLASAASRRVSNRPFMAAGPAILSHGRPLCALARETRDSGEASTQALQQRRAVVRTPRAVFAVGAGVLACSYTLRSWSGY